jgi:hypothetical protein
VRLDLTFIVLLCSREIDIDARLTAMHAVEHGSKSYIGWLPTACGRSSRKPVLVFVGIMADTNYGFCEECAGFGVPCRLR